MTPEEQQRARDIIAKATPGEWRYENLNWIGPALFGVFASSGPGDRGQVLFDNIEPDSNSYNNIEFMIAAQKQLPKMLDDIKALESNLEAAKAGKPLLGKTALSAKDIAALKELMAEATPGPWSWEDDRQLGQGVYTVYSGRDPGMHGLNLFGRMDTGANAENNLEFITQARTLVPKAIEYIETLQNDIARANAPKTRPAQGRNFNLG